MSIEYREEIKERLFNLIRVHLMLAPKFSNEIIDLNLPYLFTNDKFAAISFVQEVERQFQIQIPDDRSDLQFFLTMDGMANLVIELVPYELPRKPEDVTRDQEN